MCALRRNKTFYLHYVHPDEHMHAGFVQAKRSAACLGVYTGSRLKKMKPAISHMHPDMTQRNGILYCTQQREIERAQDDTATREYVSMQST